VKGWGQSIVRPVAHFFVSDDVSACGESTRLVCRGNDAWPPANACPACREIFIAWRRIEPPKAVQQPTKEEQ
jgi:hypothetical protein